MATVLKILIVAAVALMLMGGEFACTQSERPLGSRDEGFIDYYLVGAWAEVKAEDDDWIDGVWIAGELAYEAMALETGELRVVEYEDGAPTKIYTGYSTLLDGRKFLNLRLVECPGCDEEKLAKLGVDDCPWRIVRYWTFLPDETADALAASGEITREVLDRKVGELRGRLLFYEFMDDDFVADAIRGQRIAGDADCKNCVQGGACLRASVEALRDFIRREGPELFFEDRDGGIWAVIRSDPDEPDRAEGRSEF